MPPQVCVARDLSTDAGQLGLEPWSAPRMVSQVSASSTGDGAITGAGLTTQPGRLMINAQISWVSDSPLPSMMRLQVIRSYRTIVCSNPNAVQIWDSWNYGIDRAARVPDAYNLVNSLCTLGIDIGTDNVAQPVYGRVHQDYPVTASEEWYELPAGSTLNVHYRCYVWTPPPWSNNASANNPLHEAHSRGVKLRLWAFPTMDEAVR
ncbi:hypothetical protein NDR87_31405 [Nocardia sp. CDC159]|uniref:DUF7172 domain-containing protein n=1 Tax=Nocardia pulmonis TaxID=2951408 RepID=A0A9X2EGU2_9NOCA|nr:MULTISPECIES: hypothetical protein [Nocardia]MCM6777943.1 hypothetical protein [Nocardia pulmonis]MCM6790886.1 hypothetical protein [Nocardia sp. CDC159]